MPPDELSLAMSSSEPFAMDSPFVMGATLSLSASSSSSTPVDSFLNDYFVFLDDSRPSTSEAGPSFSPSRTGSTSSMSSKWWEDQDTFCRNKQKLLDTFLAHRHQCAFDVHVGRFKASLSLPPPQRPHPALMDAIYLMACFYSPSPHLSALQPHFLQLALSGISSSLQQSDRLLHIVQASCLIAIYFFSRGRTLEGYYHSSTAARLAVSLGLHQIKPEDWYQLELDVMAQPLPFVSFKSCLQLSAPRDSVEYAERVAAFWQVFTVDRAWSVASGLPAALPDDDSPRAQIETVWPTAISDSSDGPNKSHMFAQYSSNKLNPYLRARAVTFFERSYRLSSMTFRNNNQFWGEHKTLDDELSNFASNLPSFAPQGLYQEKPAVSDVELASIHIMIHAATIHLHRDFMEMLQSSYNKCLVAANLMTTIVQELCDVDYDFLDPIVSTCLKCGAHVYLQVLKSQQVNTSQAFLGVVQQELSTLVSAMQCLGRVFPIAANDASKTAAAKHTAHSSFYT
ncbi:hypothetical protein NM688_g9266 [Phlebia brevispora]|uniref:Uncharacterized protein n=1 Tax=Phlebia brevispora TaxID=194682 RepID=A0ACC1RJG0_9APHY|nr:hypothetical protein NM688_g9266 [Phlebia brevispora]